MPELSRVKENSRPIRRINLDRAGVSAYTRINQEENRPISKREDVKESKKMSSCLFRRGGHHHNQCNKFAERSFKEGKNFFFKNSLWLGCSNHGHVVANCRKKMKCKECFQLHPKCFHIKETEKNKEKS